jgi:lactoylglutathione lyase
MAPSARRRDGRERKRMKFAYTILYVDDVARSLAFYRDAFGLAVRFQHESGDYGELDTGGTTLALSSRQLMTQLGKNPQRPSAEAPCSEIAFSTDDVPAALARAQGAGARLVQAAEQMPWGQTVGYVADLDGFLVEICTPMGG